MKFTLAVFLFVAAGLLLSPRVFAQDATPPGATATVPAGQTLTLHLVDAITLDAISPDHRFHAQVSRDIKVGDQVVIPKDTDVFLEATKDSVANNPFVVKVTVSVDYLVLNGQHIAVQGASSSMTAQILRPQVRAAGRTLNFRLTEALEVPVSAPAAAPPAVVPSPAPTAVPGPAPTPEPIPMPVAAPAPSPAAIPVPMPAPAPAQAIAGPTPPPLGPPPAVGATAGSGPTIALDTLPLGPITQNGRPSVLITSDGSRALVMASDGSRVLAYVDGQPGPVVRDIPVTLGNGSLYGTGDSPAFSPDGKRVAYIVALDGGQHVVVIDSTQSPAYQNVSDFQFAPVGHRLAYCAQLGSKSFIVDDGKAGPMYDGINDRTITFSPDGQHLAYAARINPAAGHSQDPPTRVVMDGAEQQSHYAGVTNLTFNHDGKHFAYVASTGYNHTCAVIDGQQGPDYAAIERLSFSDDGSRSVYVARMAKGDANGNAYVLVDNGTAHGPCAAVKDLAISANGQRMAYVATVQTSTAIQTFVIDNGQPGMQYNDCQQLQCSPDGKTLAYVATAAQGVVLVVNGQENGPFQAIQSAVAFSADGRHWACIARPVSGAYQVLMDGKTIPLGQWVFADKLAFSDDSAHLILNGHSTSDGAPQTVDLSVAGPAPDNANAPTPAAIVYSPNHQHCLKVFEQGYGSSSVTTTLTLDDKPVTAADLKDPRLARISDDGAHFAYVGQGTGQNGQQVAHVVYDATTGTDFRAINDLVMSDDGRHVAFVAQDTTGSYFVGVDGLRGPAFQDVEPLGSQFRGQSANHLIFAPDGSLTFFPVIDGKLYRCTYAADALKSVPSMFQVGSVTPGLHKLDDFQSAGDGSGIRQLALAPDGTIFGITSGGGKNGKGTIFSCKADGSGYAILHSFYGGEADGEWPESFLIAPDGNVYGAATTTGPGTQSVIFHYDPKADQYAVLKVEQPLKLCGLTANHLLIGVTSRSGFGSNKTTPIWTMNVDGNDFKLVNQPMEATDGILGSSDALYLIGSKAIFRLSSPDASPVTVHEFANSPDDGTDPDSHLSVDSAGRVYGYTQNGGTSGGGVIFRISADGSDYKVVCNPDQRLNVSGVFPGDDGAIYGIKQADSFGRDGGVFSVPADGGQATILGEYHDQETQHHFFWHDSAIYGFTQTAVFKYQVPQPSLIAGIMPNVVINPLQPSAMESIPVQFTDPANAP